MTSYSAPTEDAIRNDGAIPTLDQVTRSNGETDNAIKAGGPLVHKDASAVTDWTDWLVSGCVRNMAGVLQVYDGSAWVPFGGTLTNKGVWNASTNTPALVSSVGTQGYFYVVSVSGATNLDGITDWVAGDWAMFDGAAWQKIDNTSIVASIFSRTGAVVAVASDYDASQVDNDSTVVGAFVDDALDTLEVAAGLNTTHRTSSGADHTFLDQSVVSAAAPVFAVTNMTGTAAGLDSDATAHAAADGSSHTFIDQSVVSAASPVFAVTNMTGTAAGLDSDATAHAASAGISHSYIQNNIVDLLLTFPNAAGGVTTSAGTIQVKDLAGANLAKECVVLLTGSDTEYAGDLDMNANVAFTDTGAGSILASGTCWAVVKTDATGLANITATNANDETVWMHACTAEGTDALANGVLVRGCIPDDATWSA